MITEASLSVPLETQLSALKDTVAQQEEVIQALCRLAFGGGGRPEQNRCIGVIEEHLKFTAWSRS